MITELRKYHACIKWFSIINCFLFVTTGHLLGNPWILFEVKILYVLASNTAYTSGCRSLYIFWYYVFIIERCPCAVFLWPLHLGWLLVLGLYKEDYFPFLKCISVSLNSFCGKWKGCDPVYRLILPVGIQ